MLIINDMLTISGPGPTPSEFLGTANIECSAQPESCSMSDTLSALQYQADLWDLRQAHDVCLSDYEQFRIRVFQAVAVMIVTSGAYLLSGMPMVRSFCQMALSEFKALFSLLGLVLVTMYLVYTVTVHRF